MTNREWLHRVFDLKLDIRGDNILLEHTRSSAEYLSPNMVKREGQSKGGENRKEEILEKVLELEQKILENKKKAESIKLEIYAAILSVENAPCREILKYRYIECLTMSAIASRMGYSERNLRRKLRDAEKMIKPSED